MRTITNSQRIKKALSALLFSVTLAVSSFSFLLATPQPALADIPVADIPGNVMKTKDTILDVIKEFAVPALTSAATSLFSYTINQIAYQAAVALTSDCPGKKPCWNSKSFESGMKDAVMGGIGEAIGTFSKESGLEKLGLNLCEPKGIDFKFKLNVGLGIMDEYQPPKPKCDFNNVIKNWESAAATLKPNELMKNVSLQFIPGQSPVDSFMSAQEALRAQGLKSKELDAAKRQYEATAGGGFSGIYDKVSGRVKTPASQVKKEADNAKDAKDKGTAEAGAQAANSQTAGNRIVGMLVTAASTFAQVLASRLWNKMVNGMMTNEMLIASDPNLPYDFLSNPLTASPQSIATALAPQYAVAKPKEPGVIDPVADMSICPGENQGRKPDNCTIDSKLAQALTVSRIKPTTVRELIAKGDLHGDWKLIPSTDPLADNERNCFASAYCEGNLKKLRALRVLPIGWELAAQQAAAKPSQAITLNSAIARFNECDENGQWSAATPYCHLVDPDWVIKIPPVMCKALAYGPTLMSPESPKRNEECVDTRTCLRQDDAGNCIGDSYGYCVQEKSVWRFDGDQCPDQYASCRTVTDTATKKQASYLMTTVDAGICGSDNVGCTAYATSLNTATDPSRSAEAWDTAPQLYLNRQAEKCQAQDDGCTSVAMMPSTRSLNLVRNPGFEDVEDFDNNGSVPKHAKFWWPMANVTGSTESGFVVSSPQPVASGSRSVVVNPNADVVAQVGIAIRPNKTHTVSATFLSQVSKTGLTASVGIELYDKNGTRLTLSPSLIFTDAPSGVTCTSDTHGLSASIANAATKYRAYCSFMVSDASVASATLSLSAGGADYILADDIQLEEGNLTDFHDKYGGDLQYANLKLPPPELGCKGESTDPAVCAKYAGFCRETEVGCDRYTPANGDPAVPAIVSSGDRCPAECVGYDVFKQEATTFERDKFPVYFIPKTALACSSADVGCSEFTDVQNETVSYYKRIQQCQLPSDPESQTFYTWEGSDTQGYEIKEWTMRKTASTVTNQSQGRNASDVCATPATCANAGFAPCTALTRNAVTDTFTCNDQDATGFCSRTDIELGDFDCREFYDQDGNRHYRRLSQTILATADCRYNRITARTSDTTQARLDCDASDGVWNATTLTCTYRFTASGSDSCSAALAGCRAYKGNTAGNVRQVALDDFEAGLTGWSPSASVKQSAESVVVGGHSLEISANATVDRTLAGIASKGRSYSFSFWARGSGALSVAVVPVAASTPSLPTITLSPNWKLYSVGPIFVTDTATSLSMKPVGQAAYVDNLVIREVQENIYAVSNSWKTPASCNTAPDGTPAPLQMLGCREYRDTKNQVSTLRQFSQLCRDRAVGCGTYVNTQNTLQNPYSETWNAVCSLSAPATGLAEPCDYKVKNPATGALVATMKDVCRVSTGETTCRFHLDGWDVSVPDGRCANDNAKMCSADTDCGARSFSNWAVGEPNDYSSSGYGNPVDDQGRHEGCTEIMAGAQSGVWNDLPCDINVTSAGLAGVGVCDYGSGSLGLTAADLTWTQAKNWCLARNAKLAVIDSLAKNDAVKSACTVGRCFIGLKYSSAVREFVWSDGTRPSGSNTRCLLSTPDRVRVAADERLYLAADVQYQCKPEAVGCRAMGKSHQVFEKQCLHYESGQQAACTTLDSCSAGQYGCTPAKYDACKCTDVATGNFCLMKKGDASCTVSLGAGAIDKWDTIALKNNPAKYDQQLCTAAALGCNEYNSSDGLKYFKDPSEKLCEYKEDVAMPDGARRNGWFRKSTSGAFLPCAPGLLKNGLLLPIVKHGDVSCNLTTACTKPLGCICPEVGTPICSVALGQTGCGYQGWVGQCPEQFNRCEEFVDPLETSNTNPDGKAYYYMDNNKLDKATCSGTASLKQGCVVFNQTSQPVKRITSYATYRKEDLSKTSDRVPTVNCETAAAVRDPLCDNRCLKVVNGTSVYGSACSTDADCGPKTCTVSGKFCTSDAQCLNSNDNCVGASCVAIASPKNDANVVLKVRRDRECSQWFECTQTTPVYDENSTTKWRSLCMAFGLCRQSVTTSQGVRCIDYLVRSPEDGRFTVDKYAARDTSYRGPEFSGYTIPNAYPPEALRPLVDKDSGTEKIAAVTRPANTASKLCATNADCPAANDPDPNKRLGRCVKATAADSSGVCAFDLFGGAALQASQVGSGANMSCRGYPESDSPYGKTVLSGADYANRNKPNTKFTAANICNPAATDTASLGKDNACDCSYGRADYGPGFAVFRKSGSALDSNVCTLGDADKLGKPCSKAEDCSAVTGSFTGVCTAQTKYRLATGWKGICIDKDATTKVNAADDQYHCLQWLPVDQLSGEPDVYNQFPEAGFVMTDFTSSPRLLYCSERYNPLRSGVTSYAFNVPITRNLFEQGDFRSPPAGTGNGTPYTGRGDFMIPKGNSVRSYGIRMKDIAAIKLELVHKYTVNQKSWWFLYPGRWEMEVSWRTTGTNGTDWNVTEGNAGSDANPTGARDPRPGLLEDNPHGFAYIPGTTQPYGCATMYNGFDPPANLNNSCLASPGHCPAGGSAYWGWCGLGYGNASDQRTKDDVCFRNYDACAFSKAIPDGDYLDRVDTMFGIGDGNGDGDWAARSGSITIYLREQCTEMADVGSTTEPPIVKTNTFMTKAAGPAGAFERSITLWQDDVTSHNPPLTPYGHAYLTGTSGTVGANNFNFGGDGFTASAPVWGSPWGGSAFNRMRLPDQLDGGDAAAGQLYSRNELKQLFVRMYGIYKLDQGTQVYGKDVADSGWDARSEAPLSSRPRIVPALTTAEVINNTARARCYPSVNAWACEEGPPDGLTVDGETGGQVGETVGGGMYLAHIMYYAYADKDHMPLVKKRFDAKGETYNFNGPGDIPFTSYVESTGLYKNQRGVTGPAGTPICDGSEWGKTNVSCTTRYFQETVLYNCSAATLASLPACGSKYPCHRVVDGGEACVFKPRIQFTDNWGICSGTCAGGPNGGLCIANSSGSGPNSGDGVCKSKSTAWIDFAGEIVVKP